MVSWRAEGEERTRIALGGFEENSKRRRVGRRGRRRRSCKEVVREDQDDAAMADGSSLELEKEGNANLP